MTAEYRDTDTGLPRWWARRAVLWSAGRLPLLHRERYRAELVAELYGMSSSEQLRPVMGVLTMTRSLRSVLQAEPLTNDGDLRIVTKRSLRCRAGRHAWVLCGNELGERFLECRRCHKFRDPTPISGPVGRGWGVI